MSGRPTVRGAFRRLLVSLVFFGAIAFGLVWGALAFVESGRGRTFILELAKEQGLALEYDALALSLREGTMRLDGLRLASPARFAPTAPHWLSVRSLAVRVSMTELLKGRLRVDDVSIEGVRFHVVVDEQGLNSAEEALAAFSQDEPPPPTPLSRTLKDLAIPIDLSLESLVARDVVLMATELLPEGARRVTTASGLALRARVRHEDGSLTADARLVSEARPDGLLAVLAEMHDGVTRTREFALRTELSLALDETSRVTARLRASRLRQSFAPELDTFASLVDLDAAIRFDDRAGELRVEVEKLALFDGAVNVSAKASLADGAALPWLEEAAMRADLEHLLRGMPNRERLAIEAPELYATATGVAPAQGTRSTKVEMRFRALSLGARKDALDVSLASPSFDVDAELREGDVSATARFVASRVRANADRNTVDVGGFSSSVRSPSLRISGESPFGAVGDVVADVAASSVDLAAGDDRVALRDLAISSRARLDETGRPSPRVEATVRTAEASLAGGTRVTASRLRAVATSRELSADLSFPLSLRSTFEVGSLGALLPNGDRAHGTNAFVKLDADVESEDRARLETRVQFATLDGQASGTRFVVASPALGFSGPLRRDGVSTFVADLAVESVRAASEEGRLETIVPRGSLRFAARELRIDEASPLRSRVLLSGESNFGGTQVAFQASLANGDGDFSAQGHVGALARIPALAAIGERLKLLDAGLDARLEGHYAHLDTGHPSMRHRLELTVSHYSVHAPGLDLDLPSTRITVAHEGEGDRHHAAVDVRFDGAELDGVRLETSPAWHADVRFDGALRAGSLESRLIGPGGLDVVANLQADVPAEGPIRFTEEFTFDNLGALGLLIPARVRDEHPIELGSLSVDHAGSGTVEFIEGEAPRFTHHAAVRIRGIHYTPRGLVVHVPQIKFELDAHGNAESVAAHASVRAPYAEFENARHYIGAEGIEQDVSIESVGPLAERRFTTTVRSALERVTQDYYAPYPLENVSLTARIDSEGAEVFELEHFELSNPRGGTRLEMTHTFTRSSVVEVDGAEGARRRARGGQQFSMRGELVQDLSRIDAHPESFRGSGRFAMPFSIDSGGGSLFRLHATLDLDDVDLALPQMGFEMHGLRANIPLEETVEWTPENGVSVVPNTERNAFARVRYQDVQPFLTDSSHLEVDSLSWHGIRLGPIVGSLQVDRNLFSIHGIRIERDEAVIAGQLTFDYLPGAERLQFRGNVTGLRLGGTGDPLDANASLVFDPERLELDGRIQIVRISRSHLLEMLSMIDPYEENTSFSSLRTAMRFGYPQSVSLTLSQGLMSMNVELGGLLGSFVSIGEIQGIALGPFMSRHVAPYLSEDGFDE